MTAPRALVNRLAMCAAALAVAALAAGAAGEVEIEGISATAGGGALGGANAVKFFVTSTVGGFTKEGLTDERDGEKNGDDGDCDEVVGDDGGCHGVES